MGSKKISLEKRSRTVVIRGERDENEKKEVQELKLEIHKVSKSRKLMYSTKNIVNNVALFTKNMPTQQVLGALTTIKIIIIVMDKIT